MRPPTELGLLTMLEQASTFLQVLRKFGSDDTTEYLEGAPLPKLTSWGSAVFDAPLDLLDVMRLQLLADLRAGREVRTCRGMEKGEPCRKLFIWPEGSTRKRIAGRGRPPEYCSQRHAAAAYQARRRLEEKRKKEA